MNKHLLFILVIFFISIAAKSQTNVSGNITSNTTWTKANSPYVLTGNVGVPTAYTLTIKPGVTVQRSGDYQIFINGAIKCNGTKADSIVFISPNNLDYTSKYFIEFQKSSLDNSSFRFVTIQNNGGTNNYLRLGNESENVQTNPKNSGILYISRSSLKNGYLDTKGYQTTASLRIDSSFISSSHIAGDTYSERIDISNTQIYNSYIPADPYSYGTSFTNCYLNGVDMIVGCCGANFSFINSSIENSKVDDFLGQSDNAIIMINNSTFTNTSVDDQGATITASNSNFTFTDKVYNREGTQSNYLLNTDNLSMTNCNLLNNSSDNINGINITGYGASNTFTDTVARNRFTNLYDAVTVNNFSDIQLDSNNFSTVGRYDIINYSTKDFSALYDYFQLKQGQTIDDVIYDQNDDLSYGLVTYTPYATDSLVLPLKLLSFTGNRNGQSVQLNWQTSNEVNTLRYVVQRTTGSGFTDIGTVAASGKADNTANYYFTDETPTTGTNEYRLKIIDADGKYAYSAVVPIVFTKTVNGLFLYPNPAKNYVIVEHAAISNNTQLQLVDATGKIVKIVSVMPGSTQTKINVAGMAKGTYRIVWQTGNKKESQLLFVQ